MSISATKKVERSVMKSLSSSYVQMKKHALDKPRETSNTSHSVRGSSVHVEVLLTDSSTTRSTMNGEVTAYTAPRFCYGYKKTIVNNTFVLDRSSSLNPSTRDCDTRRSPWKECIQNGERTSGKCSWYNVTNSSVSTMTAEFAFLTEHFPTLPIRWDSGSGS